MFPNNLKQIDGRLETYFTVTLYIILKGLLVRDFSKSGPLRLTVITYLIKFQDSLFPFCKKKIFSLKVWFYTYPNFRVVLLYFFKIETRGPFENKI